MALTSDELSETLDSLEEVEEDKEKVMEDLSSKLKMWLRQQPLDDEYNIAKRASQQFRVNLSEIQKEMVRFPQQYTIQDENIIDVVRKLRDHRKALKGQPKKDFTKAIINIINGYSSHLDDCFKAIYWLSDYTKPMKSMSYREEDLRKIHEIKDYETRLKLVDLLCKYWETNFEKSELSYGDNYFRAERNTDICKKEFTKFVKSLPNRNNWSDKLNDHILKCVSNNPSITCRGIMDRMDTPLQNRSSPQMIAKTSRKLGITIVNEQYFKIGDDIKKDINSYVAAFIDSDGYITVDKSLNPRIGLVATGDRGKAFMIEMRKALGIGNLHLDQKSPQNTRLVNRLNFYARDDIHKLLTDCRPHFRMKGPQADLLLELIRIKKYHKKEDWAKERTQEIFQLMKWNNHQDNKNYDWLKYGVDIYAIKKLEGNCKMTAMDKLESIIKQEVD